MTRQDDPAPPAGGDDAGAFRQLVMSFAGPNAAYYVRVFGRIRGAVGTAWPFNGAALLLGPVWAAARGCLLLFWIAFLVDLPAVVGIGVGLAGNLGGPEQARAERLVRQATARAEQAAQAEAGGADNAAGLKSSAAALQRAADAAAEKAQAAKRQGPLIAAGGLLLLLAGRLLCGVLANRMLQRRFARWRSERNLRHGLSMPLAALAGLFCLFAYGLTAYRFAAAAPPPWLAAAPSNRDWHGRAAAVLDRLMEDLGRAGTGVFGAITGAINLVLDGFAAALTGTPWPVTMTVILALAWQLAGPRVAIFSAAALAYLALLGFWEKSLETVALLGTAALLCLLIGIPLGIVCGRRPAVYAALRPALDFMQTMPAFVYLIPAVMFFGLGRVPGIIATIIFAMPPAVRLTALGIQQVPAEIVEAARAFGCTDRQLLFRVQLPSARPSIMAGVNQTMMLALSMVVIASMIGAKGLGKDVLNALQYAAIGQGLLAGLAILLCAMIIDRIVQGRAG